MENGIRKRIILGISIISLISAVMSNVMIDTAAIDRVLIENQYAKMSASLRTELATLTDDANVCVYVWSEDVKEDVVLEKLKQEYKDEYEVYTKCSNTAMNESDISLSNRFDTETVSDFDDTVSEAEAAETAQLVTSSIEHKRDYYMEANIENNNAIASKYSDAEIVFQSKYAPMQIMKVSKKTLTKMSKDNSIQQMDLYVDMELENDMAAINDMDFKNDIVYANGLSGVAYLKQSFKGKGIKIGMLEYSLPDKSNSEINSKISEVKQICTSDVEEKHATAVARILVGKTNGIVPEAQLYATSINDPKSYYEAMEWLIGKGVNIINISAGFPMENNNYKDGRKNLDKWTDHIANQHHVHIVVSAGNYENGVTKVKTPGTAHNVITVGAYDDNNDNTKSNDTKADFSLYVENEMAVQKPNLIASGANITFPGEKEDFSGTSFAAPQVAGAVAQLCCFDSSYLLKQDAMAAVLMAGASTKIYGTNGSNKSGGRFYKYICGLSPWISDYEGAGKFYAYASKGIISDSMVFNNKMSSTTGTYTKTVSTGIQNSIRIVIFWNKNNTVGYDHTSLLELNDNDLPNFDLYVYNSSGLLLGKSEMKYSNYEIVDVKPGTKTGVIIKVVPNTNVSFSNQNVAMAVYQYNYK